MKVDLLKEDFGQSAQYHMGSKILRENSIGILEAPLPHRFIDGYLDYFREVREVVHGSHI